MSADRPDLTDGPLAVQEHEMRDGTLRVSKSESGDSCRLELSGELDLANADTLEAEMEAAWREGRTVVVDMRELEFMDSTGIAVLVAAHKRLNNGVVRLQVVESESETVRRVLRMTGLEGSFPAPQA
jgi:anti-sigma B factor antagonist